MDSCPISIDLTIKLIILEVGSLGRESNWMMLTPLHFLAFLLYSPSHVVHGTWRDPRAQRGANACRDAAA